MPILKSQLLNNRIDLVLATSISQREIRSLIDRCRSDNMRSISYDYILAIYKDLFRKDFPNRSLMPVLVDEIVSATDLDLLYIGFRYPELKYMDVIYIVEKIRDVFSPVYQLDRISFMYDTKIKQSAYPVMLSFQIFLSDGYEDIPSTRLLTIDEYTENLNHKFPDVVFTQKSKQVVRYFGDSVTTMTYLVFPKK